MIEPRIEQEPTLGNMLKQAVLKVMSRITTENIDAPTFKFLRMSQEHLARYSFAIELTKELGLTPQLLADLGCGQGYGAAMLADAFPEAQVAAVEISTKAAAKAEQNYAAKRDNLKINQGSVTATSFAPDSVDMAACFEVFEHLNKEDQLRLLQETHRILNDKGILIMSVPEPYSKNIFSGNPHHLHEVEYDELLSMLNEQGFELMTLPTGDRAEYGQSFLPKNKLKRVIGLNQYFPGIYPLYYYSRSPEALQVSSKSEQSNVNLAPVTHILVARKAEKEQN